MSLISFEFVKTYLYFLIIWVLDFVSSLISEIKMGRHRTESIFLVFIYMNIGELLSGFLVLYTKIRMMYLKSNEIMASNNTIEPELIYNDLSMKKHIKFYIFIVSILDFIGRNYTLIFIVIFTNNDLGQRYVKWILSVDILARIIFCRLMLKIKLYKHHKVSIYICSIGFFIMASFSLQSIFFENDGANNNYKSWLYILFTIIQKIFFALGDTICKILLTNKFILAHYLMFYKSLTTICFYIIFFSILLLTSKITFDHFLSIFKNDNLRSYIFYIIFKILSAFFQNFSIIKIIDIFTPIHVGFVYIISSLVEIIKLASEESEVIILVFWIFYIICFLVVAIGTLLFTEILIINACGLNEYTKKGLLVKEKLDNSPPNATILVDLNDDKSEYYGSRNCSEVDNSNIRMTTNNTLLNTTTVYNKKKKYTNI